jgi:hypothetical protein
LGVVTPVLSLEKNEILLLITGVEILQPNDSNNVLNSKKFKEISLFSKWEKFRQINEEAKLMLIATKNALDDAKVDINKLDKTKIGLVFETIFGSFTNYENFEDSIISGSLRPQEFVCSLTSFVTSAVSIFFGIKGPCITFSGLHSFVDVILYSYQLLKTKICNIVIIGEWIKFSKTLSKYSSAENYKTELFTTIVLKSLDGFKKNEYSPFYKSEFCRNFCIDFSLDVIKEEAFNYENSLGITSLAQKIKFLKQQGMKNFCLSYITDDKNKINFLYESKNL